MELLLVLSIFILILIRQSKFTNSASANAKFKLFLRCNSEYYFFSTFLVAVLSFYSLELINTIKGSAIYLLCIMLRANIGSGSFQPAWFDYYTLRASKAAPH